jgi:hypothetical protein
MQVRWKGAVLSAVVAGGLVGFALIPQQANASPQAIKFGDLTKTQKRLISGLASTEVDQARGALAKKAPAQAQRYAGKAGGSSGNFYFPSGSRGCSYTLGSNVNMDTDCQNVSDPDLAGRGQAQNETYISEDHFNSKNLLGSSNDYRRGDGGCFAYYSLDHGRSFEDVAIPFSFTRGGAYGAARQYWGGGGDTSSAFDTRGNAYYSCQVFNRGLPTSSNPDLSSALVVFRSTGNGGASYTFPARVVTEEPDVKGAGTAPFLDKQLLTVDNHIGSPFRDRVYVTWTTFAPDGSAYIYESHSADYAETWSKPVRVSAANPGLCKVNSDKGGDPDADGGGDAADEPAPAPGQCYANQYSQPFTGPDGALYVVWSNFNNAVTTGDNRNQVLLAKSTDGGSTFSTPVKATDYYDLPDCVTYTGQDPGRSCVPVKGAKQTSYFRATNYPQVTADARHPGHVFVTFGSYINRYSNEDNGCVPQGVSTDTGLNLFKGVTTAGACSNKIVVSVSRDGGATFTGTTTDPRDLPAVVGTRRQRHSDQYFQGTAWSQGTLAVDTYDRSYGNDEATGFSDISLLGSRNGHRFASVRVTSSSMPPPTQFEGQFYGDYIILSASHGVAHPIWSDTRNRNLFACTDAGGKVNTPPDVCTGSAPNARFANDQEAFTQAVRIPTR